MKRVILTLVSGLFLFAISCETPPLAPPKPEGPGNTLSEASPTD